MTNLFLVNTDVSTAVPNGAEVTRNLLASAAGVSSTLRNKNTVAAPAAPLKITDGSPAGADGNTIAWYSIPLAAVTIAGQIVASLWTKESATNANVAPSIGVYRCAADGTELATIVDPAVNLGAGEMATTAGGATDTITVTAANVTDTAILAGERLKVALFIDNAVDQGGTGSMGSGSNAQFWVNGPTGAAGQSQIAFTETILAYAPGSLSRPPLTITRHAIRRSYNW
jgi:hypothetical protein